MKSLLGSIIMLLSFFYSGAQTQFWSDTFEDTGAPSSGSRTPSANNSSGGPPATRYFWRCGAGDISTVNVYSGFEGVKFFAGEDHRLSPITQSGAQNILWSGINISGKTGLSFKGLLASGNGAGNSWDTPPNSAVADYVIIEYRIDGGAWTSGLRFFASSPTISTPLSLETTGDSIGEGVVVLNSAVFSEFSFNIPTTGTLLDLRLKAHSNSLSEEWAADNFRLFQSAPCSPPTLVLASQTTISCNGGTNGAASFTASGGGPFTYTWSPGGGNSFSASGLSAGIYTCVTTNSCGATATATVNITQPTAISLTQSSQTNVSCNGGSNGAAAVNSASGGAGGFTYNWTPGNPSGDGTTSVSGLTAGTWSCTVTDANSCTRTQTFNITQLTAISLTQSSQTNVSCNGGSNGAAAVNAASGGAGGFTYNWTPGNPSGDGTTSVTGLTAGNWTCTVTDANSCITSATFNITQPTAISLTQSSQTNVSCNGGSNGAAAVNAATGGAGGFTYNWTPGNPSGDGTTSVTGLTAGNWTCTVTDANSCTRTQTFNITQPTSALATSTAVTNVACFGNSTGAATVTATGGTPAYAYLWSTGATTSVITSQTSGTKSYTVTDANGCTTTGNVTLSQPASALATSTTVTNVACFGNSTGAATVSATGGTSSYTYLWSTGATTSVIASQTSGTKSYTVTDANGCTTTGNVTISQPASALATSTAVANVACFGNSTGSASVTATGGTPAYTYLWSTGATTYVIASQTSGTKSYTVTDANGCTTTGNVTISQPASALATSTAVTNVACFGNSTGAATVTASGGTSAYTYLWSTGATTSVIASQTSGTKSYTVTDANGCTATGNVTISQPASALATSTAVTNVACFGNSTGAATVIASGGTSAYTYLWSTGATTSVITSQTSGVKTVTVTDANGCTSVNSVTISEPALLTATVSQTNTTCNGACNGAASISVSGGTSPYAYNWSNGNTTSSQNGLCAGSYSVTMTDASGCTVIQTFTITEPAAIAISAISGNILCNGGSTTLTIMANGGTGALTGTGTYTQTAGSYTYTVSDANACSASTVITISEPGVLTVNVSAAPIACHGSTTQVTIAANGGTAPYTGTTSVVVTTGSYSYTVTDNNGCAVTETISVSEPAAIVASQTVTLCNGQSLTIGANTYTASGIYVDVLQSQVNGCDSTLTTDLTVSPAITHTQNISLCFGETIHVGANTYNTSGTYMDVLTAANGCDSMLTTVLAVNPAIDVTTNLNGLIISANESSATYQWIDCDNSNQPIAGETNQSFTASSNGNYAVIVTQNSCSDTSACVNISTVGVKEVNNLTGVKLYPNPTNGTFVVSGMEDNTNISIYNSIGDLVKSIQATENNLTVDLSVYSNGIYFIKMQNSRGEVIQKLIKN